GGRGGLGLFASPTAGFLIGFPVAAFVTGLMMERLRNMNMAAAAGIAAVVGGVVVLYGFGIVGMSIVLDRSIGSAALLVTAFIPGDLIKAVLAGLITAALYRARPASVLSRS
ncbi:MAG: biotin transporter BioY, partial [Marinomonas sp.]